MWKLLSKDQAIKHHVCNTYKSMVDIQHCDQDPSINNKEQKSIINADIRYCLPVLSEINDVLRQ